MIESRRERFTWFEGDLKPVNPNTEKFDCDICGEHVAPDDRYWTRSGTVRHASCELDRRGRAQ